jgi:hypothetical protein
MEMYNMLRLVFTEEMMSRIQAFEWFSVFRSGTTSVEDGECLGHLSMTKMNENVI